MVMGQQVRPGQLTAVPAQNNTTGITEMLTAIMPLIMIMMVFMMITPMFKGMAGAFKS